MPVARDWADPFLEQAREDLRAAEAAYDAHCESSFCMLLQMAYEKLAKAAFARKGNVPIKVHEGASRLLVLLAKGSGRSEASRLSRACPRCRPRVGSGPAGRGCSRDEAVRTPPVPTARVPVGERGHGQRGMASATSADRAPNSGPPAARRSRPAEIRSRYRYAVQRPVSVTRDRTCPTAPRQASEPCLNRLTAHAYSLERRAFSDSWSS
jgi:hypothetical protein